MQEAEQIELLPPAVRIVRMTPFTGCLVAPPARSLQANSSSCCPPVSTLSFPGLASHSPAVCPLTFFSLKGLLEGDRWAQMSYCLSLPALFATPPISFLLFLTVLVFRKF